MEQIKIDLNNPTREEISLIADYFRKGRVIVYPTDTIYGIGCIATDKKAVNKIYKIKKRDKKRPLLILVKNRAMLKKYCFVSKKQDKYLKKIWPGPVSAVLKSMGALPKEVSGGGISLAVRLPKSDFLVKIISAVGFPIVSTSLNISGKKNISNINMLLKVFNAKLGKNQGSQQFDLIIDVGRITGKPSRLVDLTDIKNIRILRK